MNAFSDRFFHANVDFFRLSISSTRATDGRWITREEHALNAKVDRLSHNALAWMRLLQNCDIAYRFVVQVDQRFYFKRATHPKHSTSEFVDDVMHSASDGLNREEADDLLEYARSKYGESAAIKIVPLSEYAEREFWFNARELDEVAPEIPMLNKFCSLDDMAERYGDEISHWHSRHDEIRAHLARQAGNEPEEEFIAACDAIQS